MTPGIPSRTPLATYRLQFGPHLRFDDARRLVGYLDDLGVTEAYASPLFRSREHSSHGYDVVDHSSIEPEFGSEDDFRAMAEELRGRGMGLIMDVVPNHMGIDHHNAWWQDVLENGISSPYAKFFDIDWDPPEEALKNKVLLPILGDQFGRILENGEIRLAYEDQHFRVCYYDHRFPVGPRTWVLVLRLALDDIAAALEPDDIERMEFESIITELENLPPHTERDPQRIEQRYREKEVAARRLGTLVESNETVRGALERAIAVFNGRKGDPRSFDRLEELLDRQAYRLSYWRVAVDEINYRRFFDINELAAIRVEDCDVFEAVHALIFRFLRNGWVTGLRIDHPDGLLDPRRYFEDLQEGFRNIRLEAAEDVGQASSLPADASRAAVGQASSLPADASRAAVGQASSLPSEAGSLGHDTALTPDPSRSLYVVVEKILEGHETLREDWPVCGTTGYEFLNLLNGIFVDRPGMYALRDEYHRFTGRPVPFRDVLYDSKKAVLNLSMSSELHVLAWQLNRISYQHRWSRDFTRTSLRRALRELIACFPVYRTYIRPGDSEVGEEDRNRIFVAGRAARRRNPEMSPSFFDFIASVLRLEDPDGLTDAQRDERRHFVFKFQQVTGPVTAKGLEDTAFYRYYPLASLNEVGGEIGFGTTPDEFHHQNAERRERWPYGMLTTATHDTKRAEDVRARLNVLSEVPDEWSAALRRWHEFNAPFRTESDGEAVPDANEEYLLYQTLVGTWPLAPLEGDARQEYAGRITGYMEKALREAKLHTSWLNIDAEYEQAVRRFVESVLTEPAAAQFRDDLHAFTASIADAGFLNSLSQLVLKVCAPGVPDFYQGTELWSFTLVDPDNRRPVDFERRQRLLAELQERAGDAPALVADLLARWPDERLKLYATWRALGFRRTHGGLLLHGRYVPLVAEGPRADNVCGFAREKDGAWLLAVVPRFTMQAWRSHGESAGRDRGLDPATLAGWWSETRLLLPEDAPGQWKNVFTDEPLTAEEERTVDVSEVFGRFPVGMMSSV